MKKFFSALTALLLSICFISCMADEISDSANSQKEGSVILSIKKARTISPAEGISYKNVPEWKVTFKDKSGKYNDIVRYVQFTEESPTYTIQLPQGSFDVIFEGNALEVPFYGETSVDITEETADLSVFVAPKKKGKGSFNFTVNISGLEDLGDKTPVFDTELIPYAQGTANPTLKSDVSEPTEDGKYKLTITGSDISSGFYQLSIKYTWISTSDAPENQNPEPKEIFYPYHDFLVEIVDGLTTTGSENIIVSLDDSKRYYATTGETKGNGAFESLPKNLDELLDDINSTTISRADIIVVDKIDSQNPSYPEIDVSKVNKAGKTYKISTIGNESFPCYNIIAGAGEGDNPTIYMGLDVNTINLNSSVPGKTVNVMKSYEVKELHLGLKNSTSVAIGFQVPVILDDIDSFEYYLENPFMTAEYETSVSLSSTLGESYTIVYKSISETETGYYIVPASSANPSINGIEYELKVKKDDKLVEDGTIFYGGDTVTIEPVLTDGSSFLDDTSFAWFINGKKTDCTAQTYTITFGEGDAVQNNSIICLVGYGTGYATAKIEINNVTDKTRTLVLYNNVDTSDTAKPALSYATLTDSGISGTTDLIAKDYSTTITDYCFDASNNMYALVKNEIEEMTPYSIKKYTYSNGGYRNDLVKTYTSYEQATTFDYIEASSDDTLYAVITPNSGTQSIVKLTLKEPADETSENGTITYKQYFLPTAWTSGTSFCNILTFCTDGTNFYVIAYLVTESENTATAEVKLASCTASDYQLTENENASIILDSITNQNRDTGNVFSEYSDSLEYRDLCYIENTEGTSGTLYLLVRDVICSAYSDVLSSRGALCTFTVSDSGIQQDKIDIGYQTTSSTVSYTGDYDSASGTYPTITRTTYFGDGSLTFYGPVKFIARKEDELIIADDGYSVTEEDYGSAGHRKGTLSSKNAVVTYNLNDKTLNFTSLDGEYFENKYSGYFYGSGFYEQ